jgi:hypothetical protein
MSRPAQARIEVHEGVLVVVKEASGHAAELLRVQAALLARADHPGVVRPVGACQVVDGCAELRTRFAGSASAAVAPPADLAGVARLVAGLADALAHLHGRGIVHGRLCAEHVVIGPDGQPVLCGIGPATCTGSAADADAHVAAPADDVAALGRLAAGWVAAIEPSRREGASWASLAELAHQATVDDPAARPTAAALAARAAELVAPVGDSGVRGGTHERWPTAPAGAARTRSRRAWVVGGVVVAPFAGWLLWPADAPPAADTPRPTAPPARAVELAASPTCPSGGAVAPTAERDAGGSRWVDVDGDGCVEEVRVEGQHVAVAGARYAAGSPGDVALVGDWDCDGVHTPGAYRPATGELFLFDGWATPGHAVVARAGAGPADTDPPRC